MTLLKGTWVLKIAALFAALLTYQYIRTEIAVNEKQNSTDASYKLIKLTAKSLPVKVRLETTPPDGYRIAEDQVSVSPDHVIVIGPEALLENAWNAETAIVDLSESTKPVKKKIPLESVGGIHLVGEPYQLDVSIPIEQIEEEPQAPEDGVAQGVSP